MVAGQKRLVLLVLLVLLLLVMSARKAVYERSAARKRASLPEDGEPRDYVPLSEEEARRLLDEYMASMGLDLGDPADVRQDGAREYRFRYPYPFELNQGYQSLIVHVFQDAQRTVYMEGSQEELVPPP